MIYDDESQEAWMREQESNRMKVLTDVMVDGLDSHTKQQPWRAEKCDNYWYVHMDGQANLRADIGTPQDDMMYAIGNYFKTEAEAKASSKYSIMNDPNDYSFSWDKSTWKDDENYEWWDYSNKKWRIDKILKSDKEIYILKRKRK